MSSLHSIRLRRIRARARGFTLVELTVALVAGLIVGIAVVALSKEASNTFQEETRAATAEMGLRTAIDRIRSDVARAAFMSTPNIVGDTNLDPLVVGATYAGDFAQIGKLTGVRVHSGGSRLKANITGTAIAPALEGTDDSDPKLSAANNLSPDAIDISGNMTSADFFVAGVGTTTPTGSCAGGNTLNFQMGWPATQAIVNGPAPQDVLNGIFLPGGMATGMARVLDITGRTQYVLVCGVTYTAGAAPAAPTVTLAVSPIKNVKGFQVGRIFVNPVSTVRWRIARTSVYPAYAPLNPQGDTSRYDLYRGFVDSTGADAGIPELVAEYAVDLKFAWTWDSGTVLAPVPNRYLYDAAATTDPYAWQKIRSVGIRLATRTALADRKVNVPVPGAPTSYLFRYCTTVACPERARVRTVMTEVALQNQSKAWW